MIFFSKAFLDFFKDLRKNNDRDWFNDNKKRYKRDVQEPFKSFIWHMILKMREKDPGVMITPRDAIFRIYRDIRFSNDKTPYKEHVSAVLSRGGRKDMTTPGIYLQMNDEEIRVYSGIYKPDKDHLEKIRTKIASEPDRFKKLYNEKKFKSTFGEIRGEKNKRIPKLFTEAADREPLIFNKAFYFFNTLDPDVILKEGFDDVVLEHWKIASPINDFFEEAMNSN